METWDKLPLDLMDELAEKETYRRDVYRPIYSLHKWWARRPGSTFRTLGLAALTDDTINKDDILTERNSGTHDGLYLDSYHEQYNPNDEHIDRDVTVLDPFAGGGTTLAELNRLGADVIGYEINPVAWWTEKKTKPHTGSKPEAYMLAMIPTKQPVREHHRFIRRPPTSSTTPTMPRNNSPWKNPGTSTPGLVIRQSKPCKIG